MHRYHYDTKRVVLVNISNSWSHTTILIMDSGFIIRYFQNLAINVKYPKDSCISLTFELIQRSICLYFLANNETGSKKKGLIFKVIYVIIFKPLLWYYIITFALQKENLINPDVIATITLRYPSAKKLLPF